MPMFKYTRAVLKGGPKIISIYNKKAKPYLKNPDSATLEQKYKDTREVFVHTLSLFRIDWKIDGIENLDEATARKNVLIVGNHNSDLDALAMIAVSKGLVRIVGKKEIQKAPKIVPDSMRIMGGLFMDRQDLKQSLKVILEVSKSLQNKEGSFLIYPEGTRNRDPINTGCGEFHSGTFKAAIKAKAPILCYAQYGGFRVLKLLPDYKRLPLEMKFFKIIEPEEYEGMDTNELSAYCKKIIEEGIVELKKEDERFFREKLHKIPLKKGKIR